MRKTLFTLSVIGVLVLALTGAALAAPAVQWKTIGNGAWMPAMGHDSQHGLVTVSYPDATQPYGVAWGGLKVLNGPTDLASLTTASFWFNASQTGGSGGSPRLVFWFADGGNIQLLPQSWTAGVWTYIDQTSNWDSSGPFLYQQSFATVKAAHAGDKIVAIELTNDSGWLYPTETVVVDDIMINSIAIRGPDKSS